MLFLRSDIISQSLLYTNIRRDTRHTENVQRKVTEKRDFSPGNHREKAQRCSLRCASLYKRMPPQEAFSCGGAVFASRFRTVCDRVSHRPAQRSARCFCCAPAAAPEGALKNYSAASSVHSRCTRAAAWARVAVPCGSRRLPPTPLTMPCLTAHAIASAA